MKVKIIFVSIAFFVFAQTSIAQNKTVNIECNLSINETEWIKKSPLTATLTVKNNSDEKVEIYLPPNFSLLKEGKEINSPRKVIGDEYSSKEKEEDYIITKRKRNGYSYKIRQFFEFSLNSGESKTLEFNISKLAWNASMSSILVDYDWYNEIPNGNYNFYYIWSYDLGKGKNTRRISIISNKISVKLNSEK